jgi:hypothetical protein
MSIDAVLQHHDIKLFEETENAIFVRAQLNRIRALALLQRRSQKMGGRG